MSVACPLCGSLGIRDHVGGRRQPVVVRLCDVCNLVFDGLAPTRFRGHNEPDERAGGVTEPDAAFVRLGELHAQLGTKPATQKT